MKLSNDEKKSVLPILFQKTKLLGNYLIITPLRGIIYSIGSLSGHYMKMICQNIKTSKSCEAEGTKVVNDLFM